MSLIDKSFYFKGSFFPFFRCLCLCSCFFCYDSFSYFCFLSRISLFNITLLCGFRGNNLLPFFLVFCFNGSNFVLVNLLLEGDLSFRAIISNIIKIIYHFFNLGFLEGCSRCSFVGVVVDGRTIFILSFFIRYDHREKGGTNLSGWANFDMYEV